MIEAEYYQYIYLIIITLFVVGVMSYYSTLTRPSFIEGRNHSMKGGAFLLLVFLVFFIGFRPNSYLFADHMNYYYYYREALGQPFMFDWHLENIIFDNFWLFLASNHVPIIVFYVFWDFVIFYCMYLCCKKLFPFDTLLAFLVCLSAFSTFASSVNGFKGGAAASVFLVAIAYKDHRALSVILALVSYGLHHSMQLLVVAYLVTFLIKNVKWYFYLWTVCLVLSALHFTAAQTFFGSITDEKGASYLIANDDGFMTGFRLDFILYSSVPVLMGYYMLFRQKINNETYNFMLKLYLLTNSIWMLCMYSSFTNRIAYLSWFMYPIVLLYPILQTEYRSKAKKILSFVVYGHLTFTLIMFFIYYA